MPKESEHDVLQEIPDEDLPALRDLYLKDWPYGVQAYCFIQNYINWKRKKPSVGVLFTAPYGKWRDGTFVAIVTEYCYNIFFFALKGYDKLSESLKQTKRINWHRGPYICCIHEHFDSAAMKILRNIGQPIDFEIESTTWWLSKEKALRHDITCPEDMYVAPLKDHHIPDINALWQHSFPGSEAYLQNLIYMNYGYGLFRKSDGSICCWIMKIDTGVVGILKTAEAFRGKGFAKLLIKVLTKKMAEEGIDALAYIMASNITSQKLFESVGFRQINKIRWVQYKNTLNKL